MKFKLQILLPLLPWLVFSLLGTNKKAQVYIVENENIFLPFMFSVDNPTNEYSCVFIAFFSMALNILGVLATLSYLMFLIGKCVDDRIKLKKIDFIKGVFGFKFLTINKNQKFSDKNQIKNGFNREIEFLTREYNFKKVTKIYLGFMVGVIIANLLIGFFVTP
jgi:hypothetical protein